MQRIKALDPPYSDDVQKSFSIVMPEDMPPLNIFRTLAHNPRVLHRIAIGGLLDRGSIGLADRELLILRTCAVCRAEYEWGVHVAAFAGAAKFSQPQIDDTLSDEVDAALWSASQLGLLALVDELRQTSTISDALWARLREHFSDEQLIECIVLVGFYHTIGFVVNGLGVEREAFAPGFG